MAQEQFDFLKSLNSSGIFGIHNIAKENPVEARKPGQVEVAREEAREEFEPPSPFCLFFLFVIFFSSCLHSLSLSQGGQTLSLILLKKYVLLTLALPIFFLQKKDQYKHSLK